MQATKSAAPSPKKCRAVIYLTSQEIKRVEARAAQEGIRSPTLWIAAQVRKQILSA